MSLLFKVKFKPQPYELDAYNAPAHFFFCRRIEVPSDLEKGEEEGYVLLELENLSPFPLEHLNFGYLLDEAKRFAFAFAAYKRRFEGVDTGAWRRMDAALPDFIVALKNASEDTSPLVLVTEASYVGFAFDGESSLPSRFTAVPRSVLEEGENDEMDILAFGAEAAAQFGGGEPRIWIANTNPNWLGANAILAASNIDESLAAEVSFSREEIWTTDLRDPEMVEQAKKDEQQNAILWKGVLGLAAVIGLLLIGELVWGGRSLYLAQREKWNEERVEHVASINKLRTTTDTLLDFQESNLVPFKIIEELLPYTEWPKVVYRRFETDGPNGLIINARSDNQREMTEFKKRLERFDKIVSVEFTNQVTNPSGSTFRTHIRFQPGAFLTLGEVASNE